MIRGVVDVWRINRDDAGAFGDFVALYQILDAALEVTQERVAASAGLFPDGLLSDARRKTECMRAEAAGDSGPWRQQAIWVSMPTTISDPGWASRRLPARRNRSRGVSIRPNGRDYRRVTARKSRPSTNGPIASWRIWTPWITMSQTRAFRHVGW